MKKLVITLICFALASCAGKNQSLNLFSESGDVGAVKHPGSAQFDAATDTYTLTGSGINMWGTSDEFFMTWREVTGDFLLSADVAFEGEGVNAHRKLGLIIRDGVAGDAVYADIAVHGDGLTSLQYRYAKGSETQEFGTGFMTGDPLPEHIILERRGNKISARAEKKSMEGKGILSLNGSVGLGIEGIEIELPETCLVGLFICSHDADVVETAHFSNVVLVTPAASATSGN